MEPRDLDYADAQARDQSPVVGQMIIAEINYRDVAYTLARSGESLELRRRHAFGLAAEGELLGTFTSEEVGLLALAALITQVARVAE